MKDSTIDLIVDLKKDHSRLLAVRAIAQSGKIIPVIGHVYPFSQSVEAIDYVATKRDRGKVIVGIDTKI